MLRHSHLLFVVAWPVLLANPIGQQDLCSDDFKTESTSFSGQNFYEAVQTLGVSSSVAVGEVVEDGIAIVLNGQCQRQKCFIDILGDALEPSNVALQGKFLCWSFIDVIERFFEAIGSLQSGKVIEPCLNNQRLALIQVVGASQEQISVVHQGSPLSICQTFSHLPANMLQASREKFEDMELVYDQMGVRQHLTYCVVVTRPHISTDNNDLFFHLDWQVLQITDDCSFMAVSEQIYNVVIVNVSDNTTILVQQIQFVNAQIEQLRIWKTGLNVSGELAKEGANQFFIDSHIVGNAGECSSQRLLLNIVDQAMSHKVVFIHVRNDFKEGTVTFTTKAAFTTNDDPNMLSSDGMVQVGLRLYLVSVKFGMIAMSTTRRRSAALHLNVKVMFILIYRKDTIVRQSQDIQIALSLPEVLPHEFSYRNENPVTQERRVLRVNHSYPTRFSDAALVCTGVKDDEIPPVYPISQFYEHAEWGRNELETLIVDALVTTLYEERQRGYYPNNVEEQS